MRRLLPLVLVFLLVLPWACRKSGESKTEGESPTSSVKWMSYEEALEEAKSGGKPAMILFTRSGCPACAQLEEETLHDPEVVSVLNQSFLPVKVQAERRGDLLRHFRIFVFPTIWFYVRGDLVGPVIGYSPPDYFKKILRYISTGAYKTKDFDEFEG